MQTKNNSIEVKRLNRNRTFRYINTSDRVSIPEIAATLQVSSPTALNIVNELLEKEFLEYVGDFNSTGGRKAKAFSSIKDKFCAIGLDITANHITMTTTDFSEEIKNHIKIRKTFSYDEKYLKELGNFVLTSLYNFNIPKERILGVGISLPAVIDSSNFTTWNSHALNTTSILASEFEKHIPFSCTILNDANAAAIGEIANGKYLKNFVYLSLNNTVGGAIFWSPNHTILSPTLNLDAYTSSLFLGDHCHSGEFGHMIIKHGGKECYCGKKGCVNAYCNARNLTEIDNNNLDEFFNKLAAEDEEHIALFDTYIDNLTLAVDNLHMCFDCDIILGGYIGTKLAPYLLQLQNKLRKHNVIDNNVNYVRTTKYDISASSIGAAIYIIESYINTI